MGSLVVRNLSDEVHRALKRRAADAGRSTEAEVRLILEAAVSLPDRVRLGDVLREMREKHGGLDVGIERDQTSEMPEDFS